MCIRDSSSPTGVCMLHINGTNTLILIIIYKSGVSTNNIEETLNKSISNMAICKLLCTYL